jgi:fluoroacetyl-CoA thioesterase
MKPGLIDGVSEEVSFVVTEEMCPSFDGRIVHRVCATWTLVHYMELAGRRILMRFLAPHEEGVGSHVSCDHLGPAQVGASVRVVASVTGATQQELICEVKAWRDDRLIATGRTGQKVFPREVLERLLRRS